MKIPSEALILGAISIVSLLVLTMLTTEYFVNQKKVARQKAAVVNAHADLPTVAPDQVAAAKQGLKNIIQNRPDLIAALQQVLSDPEIRPTVQMLLNSPAPTPTPVPVMGHSVSSAPPFMMGSAPSVMMTPPSVPSVMMAPPSIMMAPAPAPTDSGAGGACVNCGQDTCEDAFTGTSLESSPGPF